MIKYTPALALIFILISCSAKKNSGQAMGPQVQPFDVIEVPVMDVTGNYSYPVSIEGIINNEVRAKISGYITQVLVDEGQWVRKGQLLFRLETQSLSEDAEAAKANINAAQVGVDQLKPLVEQNIVSQVQLQTAEAKLAQAKAAYKAITANIGYANITSPVNGYVGKIPYRLGTLVSPTNQLPLTTVSQTDQVYGYFSMNESDYTNFLLNTNGKNLTEKLSNFPEVQLKMANGKIYPHNGKITTVTAQIDPSTGTVSFRATFPNPEHLLANGSSGMILIPEVHKDAVVIPEQSSYEIQGKTYVFQVVNDSTTSQKIIEVNEKIDGLLLVGEGLQQGDKIVATGLGKLRDNTTIRPVMIPFDSLANSIKPIFK